MELHVREAYCTINCLHLFYVYFFVSNSTFDLYLKVMIDELTKEKQEIYRN